MDFLQRNANNQSQAKGATGAHTPSPTASTSNDGIKKLRHYEPRWLRIVFVVLLFSITILALAIAILLYFGKDKEAGYINEDRQQAVFLTNGQVYFGRIASINDKYVDLQNVYYLNSQQQPESQSAQDAKQTNFSLVKLGCELHGPSDQMIINREQVSFWENLKSDGKVAKAIEQWVSQNPDGQKCNDTSTEQQTQQQSTTSNTNNQQQQ